MVAFHTRLLEKIGLSRVSTTVTPCSKPGERAPWAPKSEQIRGAGSCACSR